MQIVAGGDQTVVANNCTDGSRPVAFGVFAAEDVERAVHIQIDTIPMIARAAHRGIRL